MILSFFEEKFTLLPIFSPLLLQLLLQPGEQPLPPTLDNWSWKLVDYIKRSKTKLLIAHNHTLLTFQPSLCAVYQMDIYPIPLGSVTYLH